jgi:hypothetical protein
VLGSELQALQSWTKDCVRSIVLCNQLAGSAGLVVSEASDVAGCSRAHGLGGEREDGEVEVLHKERMVDWSCSNT